MSSKATERLFNKIERLTDEAIAWTNDSLTERGIIIMIGEDVNSDKFTLKRKSCLGGATDVLSDLLLEATLRNPTTMMPLLQHILDIADSTLKRNN